MKFEQIVEKLKERFLQSLPGKSSWMEMSSRLFESDFYPSKNQSYKNAAVLISLIPDESKHDWVIPLIQRPTEKGPHSNQISLPGGSFEEKDKDYLKTALREANEEIGIPESEVRILGKLTPLYIPVSKFLVHPYVGYLEKVPEFKVDVDEVETLLLFHLNDFLNPNNKTNHWVTVYKNWIPLKLYVPVFRIHDHIIWGATAMIMNEFITIYKEIIQNKL